MNFCIFDVITYSADIRDGNNVLLWFDEFLYLWCDYIQQYWFAYCHATRCDLMNFCIFDVITYSAYPLPPWSSTLWFDEFLYLWCDYIQLIYQMGSASDVVIWWIFVSLMWLHTAASYFYRLAHGCDLMNFCIFDVITYSGSNFALSCSAVVIWWIFVSLMWLHTAKTLREYPYALLWFDEFLYLWCDYIQQIRDLKVNPTVVIWWIFVSLMWLHTADETERFSIERCDLMNFCIFDVITYSLTWGEVHEQGVVIWWIFVSLMWLHTAEYLTEMCRCGCDLMNFCIFDVITYSWWNVCIQYGLLWFDEFLYLWCDYIQHKYTPSTVHGVVIWWIFVSLMWLHTARGTTGNIERSLWFDEFLYLWCDYIQPLRRVRKTGLRCDLMNFCIFDVITYSVEQNGTNNNAVVIWWIFVSLMWLHTAVRPGVVSWDLLWFDEFLYLWCDYIQHNACI